MKKLLSFITTLALSCSLALSAWGANESSAGVSQPYDGIYESDPQYGSEGVYAVGDYFTGAGSGESHVVNNVKLVADQGNVTLFFSASGESYELRLPQASIDQTTGQYLYSIALAGDWGGGCLAYWLEDGNAYLGNGVVIGPKGWLEIHHLIRTGDVKPSAPTQLSSSFQQQVTTDSGQYNMYLSGFLNMELVNGENVLTNEEIQAQSISIHVKNTQNGVTRVMTQSTIEGVSVQVAQGVIKQITIKGRVQTSGGTLERYTTEISF